MDEFVDVVKRSYPNSSEQNSADGEHREADNGKNEFAEDGFVSDAVVDDPKAEGNQRDAGDVMRECPERRRRKRGEPAAEEENRGETRNGDHRRVFGDEEHGELEAGIFGVETGDEFRFGFGKIEWGAVSFRDGGSEEADKPNNLRDGKFAAGEADDVPAEKAPAAGTRL